MEQPREAQGTPHSPPLDPSLLSGALGALLSNPTLTERIRQIVSASASQTEPAPQEPSPPPAEVPVSATATGDGLSGILADPALLEKLPGIIATLKPLLGSPGGASGEPHKGKEPDSVPVCRDNLLLALRPFLSPERRQAVDSILRISKLGEILGRLDLK